MRRSAKVSALAIVAAMALDAPAVAAAPQHLIVIAPAAADGVADADVATATDALADAGHVSIVGQATVAGSITHPPARCAVEASCLVAVGQGQESERVVGVLLEPADRGVRMTLVLVDVRGGQEVSRQTYPIGSDELSTAPGTRLIEFLLLSGEDLGAETADAAASAAPPPSPAVEREGGPDVAPARRWGIGVRVGVEIPRSDLGAGILVGGSGGVAIDADASLIGQLAVDWASLGNHGATFLSPPAYPRSMAELDQRSDLLTVSAGASVRLARAGAMTVRAAAMVGVQFSWTQFEAFGMTRTEQGVAPAGTVELEASGPAGPLDWRVTVGWREATSDLGAGTSFGESVMSGLLLTAGAGW